MLPEDQPIRQVETTDNGWTGEETDKEPSWMVHPTARLQMLRLHKRDQEKLIDAARALERNGLYVRIYPIPETGMPNE